MQFQVPQFIDVQDKIVGPFTLKQFLYIASAAGISFILFFIVQTWLWFLLSAPLMAIGAGLAFVKINGIPLPKVINSATFFYWKPRTYVWQPKNPLILKTEENLEKELGAKFSLERLITGLALKSAWQYVQTGSKPQPEAAPKVTETKYHPQGKFQIYHKITGERRVAKRVDYR